MADTLTTKKVTELTENTAMSDEDLFMVGSAGTASLRKLKWSNIWNTIKTAILGKLVANNLTTTAAGYLLDARQGKALDDKISKLNTDIPYKIVVKDFRNVYTEANKGYITMNPSDFGLTHLSLVIAQHNTVPNGKILTGFYSNGTTQYIGVYNPDGSLYNGIIDFTAVAFGT